MLEKKAFWVQENSISIERKSKGKYSQRSAYADCMEKHSECGKHTFGVTRTVQESSVKGVFRGGLYGYNCRVKTLVGT